MLVNHSVKEAEHSASCVLLIGGRCGRAIYQKADKPWASFALEDARLITGQNPASGGAVAVLLLAALRKRGSFRMYVSGHTV